MSQFHVACPYCAATCECDLADVGVGFVQAGPYRCETCGAVECGAYDSEEDQPDADPETGWYRPELPVQSGPSLIATARAARTGGARV